MGERLIALFSRRWRMISLVFWLLVAIGCASPSSPRQTPAASVPEPIPVSPGLPPGTTKGPTLSREAAQKIALDFVRNEATFRFDGMEDTLKLVRSGDDGITGRWEFEYSYQSRQAGYGDRTGMILAQVITDHQAKVVVEGGGVVVLGMLDGRWDMLKQEMLK